MKLERPKQTERFGAVHIKSVQRVFELDSGLKKDLSSDKGRAICQVPYEELHAIQKEMAIVIPIKNERLKLIEGVLSGIPHQCLIVLVSNSPIEPVNRFAMERSALRDFCIFCDKNALIVHQKDETLARAFEYVGYNDILDDDGLVRDGKAEAMIIGTVLSKLAGKKYVGFIDADNYFPGAVEEYVREYAAGFATSESPFTMVRIAWHSKPKLEESTLYFKKWGRTSRVTNRFLNKFISLYSGFETEIIATGNAGEHAISLDLALRLEYSAGYSIEPYHYVNMFEKFGGLVESPYPEVMHDGAKIFQIESRNPHLHEPGDDSHVLGMIRVALECIYHSPACPKALKADILAELRERGCLGADEEPGPLRKFSALLNIDWELFQTRIENTPYGELLLEEDL